MAVTYFATFSLAGSDHIRRDGASLALSAGLVSRFGHGEESDGGWRERQGARSRPDARDARQIILRAQSKRKAVQPYRVSCRLAAQRIAF